MIVANYRKLATIDRTILIVAAPIFILGLVDLLWYVLFKTRLAVYKNGYRGYLEAGKMMVAAFFSLLYLSRVAQREYKKIFLIVAVVGQCILFGRAFYQSLYLGAERIPLSAMGGNINQMGAATVAAYMLTFCSLFAAIAILKSQSKYRWILFYGNFLLTLSAVVMTGTRAAIVTYPAMIILMVMIENRQHKKVMVKITASLIGLLVVCGVLFRHDVNQRVDDMTQDISQYNNNNSDTSVGARLAMVQAGFHSAPGIGWQSLETRAQKITELSQHDPIYLGALKYLDVHMHNEIIEAYSTKGISGVLFIALFYLGMVFYCFKSKNYSLLVFPLAIFLFGLSDVITHAKPIPASWIVGLLLSIVLCNEGARRTGTPHSTRAS
ncbi:O-antigen ligase family protein [Shimwellia pseudoproteus]|uniref:O-antigen ligase family protein n=1 Tax=Shimwellia pseudoproteus TaxID=570012 RepID=UPI001E2B7F19|nr:O-antigen ligase family protein [Shimwellia pseudoproteus]